LIQIIASFSVFNISQGSVASEVRWDLYCTVPTEYVGERIVKIGQYLAKIWTRV